MSRDPVILERRFVPAGTLVMREGEPGNCAYLIQSGAVSVFSRFEDKKIELAELGMGEIFGEMALIFDEPRSASVEAIQDCNMIVLTRQVFKQKLENTDPTIRGIISMLTQRVVSANNTVVNKKSDIDDMISTTQIIYQNIYSSLPESQQRSFQSSVLPKLDDFFASVRAFKDRFML